MVFENFQWGRGGHSQSGGARDSPPSKYIPACVYMTNVEFSMLHVVLPHTTICLIEVRNVYCKVCVRQSYSSRLAW